MEYRTLVGFSRYLFYENGDVYDIKNNVFKRSRVKMPCGYRYIRLVKDGEKGKEYRLHILICMAFNGEKPYHNSIVGHFDNNKTNNAYHNLYWTTTQENTQKACDDGCIKFLSGAENQNSIKVKVLDSATHDIVGVYGSIRDCCRHIENISASFVSAMLKKDKVYKTRSKKYIYTTCNDSCFMDNIALLNIRLCEPKKNDKRPTIFKVIFLKTGEECVYDNQTEFGNIFSIPQAIVSNCIKESKIYKDMKFELVKKEDVVNTSIYQNILDTCDGVMVENIFTGEVLEFKTIKDLKQYFCLKGNDIPQYESKGHMIFGEWKMRVLK